jgi:hypothetical protein
MVIHKESRKWHVEFAMSRLRTLLRWAIIRIGTAADVAGIGYLELFWLSWMQINRASMWRRQGFGLQPIGQQVTYRTFQRSQQNNTTC